MIFIVWMRMEMQKLGTVRRKHRIPAANSAHACYFVQVNSRWENFKPFTLSVCFPMRRHACF